MPRYNEAWFGVIEEKLLESKSSIAARCCSAKTERICLVEGDHSTSSRRVYTC